MVCSLLLRKLSSNLLSYLTNELTDAPCVVMLHQEFANANSFDDQILEFRDDFNLIIPDLLGHGESRTKGHISDTAEWLREILDTEGVDEAYLVGVSLDALLAQDFANRHPGKTASLFCVGGYDINHFTKAMEEATGRTKLKVFLNILSDRESFAQSVADISCVTPEGKDRVYRYSLNYPSVSFKHLSKLDRIFNKHRTGNRIYPMAIVVGSEEDSDMIHMAEDWHQTEPTTEYFVIHGAGHIAHLDQPELFNHVLREFVG